MTRTLTEVLLSAFAFTLFDGVPLIFGILYTIAETVSNVIDSISKVIADKNQRSIALVLSLAAIIALSAAYGGIKGEIPPLRTFLSIAMLVGLVFVLRRRKI